jgi:hypothetical protein
MSHTSSFDEVSAPSGCGSSERPVRAPHANAFAQRIVGTIRRGCLDRMLIFHRGQLEAVLADYLDQYNRHRQHRSLWAGSTATEVSVSSFVSRCNATEKTETGSVVFPTSTDWLREPTG